MLPARTSKRRAMPPRIDHIDSWIFDLDNTLYPPSARLFDLIDDRMGAFIMRLLGCDAEEARRVQKGYFHDHGTTMAGLMRHHGVDPEDFLADVHAIALDRLAVDARLRAGLARLPGRKLVFTNADADYAARVTIVTRGDALRARKDYVTQAKANPKFAFLPSTTIQEILGSDAVEGVRICSVGGGTTEDIACSGVFVFVGLEPNTGYLPDAILRTASGHVVTDAAYETSVPNVYAVGAVRAGYSGQLASAVEEAAAAMANITVA